MNRFIKIGLGIVAGLVGIVGLGGAYVAFAFPKVDDPSDVEVKTNEEMLQRGEYLTQHVTVCLDCHAERDWSRFAGPAKPGTEGAGGEHFPPEMGFPGDFYSKNITPAGIGDWTDGELIRAITEGVTREGKAMFPLMPYPYYRHLCERDLHAIVGNIRSLEPIERDVPETKLHFPMNLIVGTIPQPAEPWACPEPTTPEYGKYLTTIAGCKECHTQQDKGEQLPGMEFAGGWEFALPKGGFVSSANISPDPETGIGSWTKAQFVARFRAFANPEALVDVKPGGFNTIMPWSMYAGMTEEDLGAIYDYLKTQKPVKHQVNRFRAE